MIGAVPALPIADARSHTIEIILSGERFAASRLTPIDREFSFEDRVAELRTYLDDVEDPDPERLELSIGRAGLNVPTLVHEFGQAPGLFLTDESTIEARWLIDGDDLSVTFGPTIEAHRYRHAERRMVFTATIGDGTEILPAHQLIEMWGER